MGYAKVFQFGAELKMLSTRASGSPVEPAEKLPVGPLGRSILFDRHLGHRDFTRRICFRMLPDILNQKPAQLPVTAPFSGDS